MINTMHKFEVEYKNQITNKFYETIEDSLKQAFNLSSKNPNINIYIRVKYPELNNKVLLRFHLKSLSNLIYVFNANNHMIAVINSFNNELVETTEEANKLRFESVFKRKKVRSNTIRDYNSKLWNYNIHQFEVKNKGAKDSEYYMNLVLEALQDIHTYVPNLNIPYLKKVVLKQSKRKKSPAGLYHCEAFNNDYNYILINTLVSNSLKVKRLLWHELGHHIFYTYEKEALLSLHDNLYLPLLDYPSLKRYQDNAKERAKVYQSDIVRYSTLEQYILSYDEVLANYFESYMLYKTGRLEEALEVNKKSLFTVEEVKAFENVFEKFIEEL